MFVTTYAATFKRCMWVNHEASYLGLATHERCLSMDTVA